MLAEKCKGKMPLTEQQARALAHWWGVAYQKVALPSEEGGQVLHGLMMPNMHHPDTGWHPSSGNLLWSQEEARELENRRSSINPAAAEWVG